MKDTLDSIIEEEFVIKDIFLIYGATGFVGKLIASHAANSGHAPVLAGRNRTKVQAVAEALGMEWRAFSLENPEQVKSNLADVELVLNCAGPFLYTYRPLVEACLETGTHYLDITGEIPVYQGIHSKDKEAKEKGVALMPAVGFDVVPTDCLAVYLKQRLPDTSRLILALYSEGPAGLPPGTQRSIIEMVTFGDCVRDSGRLIVAGKEGKERPVDFGTGEVMATRVSWGDIYMAYISTGIPNISVYFVLSKDLEKQLKMMYSIQTFFRFKVFREFLKRMVKPGPSEAERTKTITHVWGRVENEKGESSEALLHGPEASVEWTRETALAAVKKVLAGNYSPGFQTPAQAFGADFILECKGVTREDRRSKDEAT